MSAAKPHTVLVAEDDDDLRDVITVILEEHGYTVATAHHGLEALDEVRRRMPDLILLDMKMPCMSGWEFAERYRAAYPAPHQRAPLVIVSAAEHVSARAEEVSAAGYLAKPFTREELLSEVRLRLRGREARR